MKKVILTEHAEVNAKGKLNSGHTKMVICIDTGEVFTSGVDTAESIDVHPSVISLCCTGRIKTVKGKHYCYVKDLAKNLESLTHSLQTKANMLEKYSDIIAEREAEEHKKELEMLEEQKRQEQLAKEEAKRQEMLAREKERRQRQIASLKKKRDAAKEKHDRAQMRASNAWTEMAAIESEIRQLELS